jgi:hypothetical protein
MSIAMARHTSVAEFPAVAVVESEQQLNEMGHGVGTRSLRAISRLTLDGKAREGYNVGVITRLDHEGAPTCHESRSRSPCPW